MNYKESLLNGIKKAVEIGEKHEIAPTIINGFKSNMIAIQDFKIKVPLMGGFNAGKSSLVNHLLHREILPTSISPETAIAAEIKYSETERIIAHSKSNKTVEFPLTAIKTISANEYLYIEVYINQPVLKEFDEITIVDMPGLDSAVEAHNQAVLNYIHEGVFYIILADAQYGLKESILSFLKELNLYQIDFAVLISKIDHKLESDIPEIVRLNKQNVETIFKKEIFVGQISTKNDNVKDFVQIIKNIDYNFLLQKKFKPEMEYLFDKEIKDLQIRLNYATAETYDLDNKITEIENQIKTTEEQVSTESKRIKEQMRGQVTDNIIADIDKKLRTEILTLITAAKVGTNELSRSVINTVRPTLVNSFENNVSQVLNQSYRNMNIQLERIQSNLSGLPGVCLSENSWIKLLEKISDPSVATTIAGLAIVTEFVAPWIELIIMLIPSLIRAFVNEDEIIRRQIEKDVIPMINGRLRDEISNSLRVISEDFINQLKQEISVTREELLHALNSARENRSKVVFEFESWEKSIKDNIHQLRQLKENL